MLDFFGVFLSATDVDWDITRMACWCPACMTPVPGETRETVIGEFCVANDGESGRI